MDRKRACRYCDNLPLMQMNRLVYAGLLAGVVCAASIRADERRFTYVYEPETLPAGAFEFEHWVTLGLGATKRSGKRITIAGTCARNLNTA